MLGVIPYVERLRIADEDSVALEDRRNRRVTGLGQIDIAVIKLPRISNYDDFLALEHEDGVAVRFVEERSRAGRRRPRDNSGFEEHHRRSRMASRKRVRAGDRGRANARAA